MDRKIWHSYCKNLEAIENFELASAAESGYVIHHRLETHTSDGVKRAVALTSSELKALGMYYDRPAEELIFMTHGEHRLLHNNDAVRLQRMRATMHSSEYRNNGMWKKGQEAWNKGLSMKDESRQKVKESLASNPNSRQNRARRLAKLYHEDNKGLTWNQFQKLYKEI